MGIFSRITDVLKANINDLIDKAEDPEKMVKQLVTDLQKDVSKATQSYGKALASQRMVKRQLDDAKAKSQDWENKAKAALVAGDENLAKSALANKVEADSQVDQYTKMYADVTAQTESIHDQVEGLKSKLDEAKSKQAMLIARSQMADTKKDLAKAYGGITDSNSFDKFQRMEEKIERKEAEADAFSQISVEENPGKSSDAEKYTQYERNAKVNDELERLKAEMGADTSALPDKY